MRIVEDVISNKKSPQRLFVGGSIYNR